MNDPSLILGVLQKDLAAVRTAIQRGENLDVRDRAARTPLMLAASRGLDAIAMELIAAGAPVGSADTGGWTALHFAAQKMSVPIAKALLDAGADPNQVDAYGNSPLWRATFDSRERGEMIALLRARGADPDLANKRGVSPRGLAHTIANYDLKQFFDP